MSFSWLLAGRLLLHFWVAARVTNGRQDVGPDRNRDA